MKNRFYRAIQKSSETGVSCAMMMAETFSIHGTHQLAEKRFASKMHLSKVHFFIHKKRREEIERKTFAFDTTSGMRSGINEIVR